MMWWKTTRTTCSAADRLSRWRRKRGPRSRSKGRRTSSVSRAGIAAASRADASSTRSHSVLAGRELSGLEDAEDGRLVDGREGAPERLVAVDDPAERPPEGVEVEPGRGPAPAPAM